jgi:hypothetical protein
VAVYVPVSVDKRDEPRDVVLLRESVQTLRESEQRATEAGYLERAFQLGLIAKRYEEALDRRLAELGDE